MNRKVLIVDDSGLARRSTRRALESAGYQVVEAEDGLSALESYFVEKPAVVLLDLVMRGMYGLDVLEKLLQMDPTARVVVISADIQTTSRDLVSAAGATAFLSKPARAEDIVAAVQSALSGAN